MGNPLHTRLCDMFGIQYPIVAFTHCKDVAAAVTNAGGIGVYGALGHSPDELNEDVRWMRERVGDKPFGIDLVFPASVPEKSLGVEGYTAQISDAHWKFVDSIRQQYQVPERSAAAVAARPTNRGGGGFMSQENGRRQAETLIDLKVPILASGLGSPTFILDAAHANGVKVFGLIGKVRQARREIEAGVDVIVAQGHDAGGHNSPIGTFSLVPQVVRIAGDTPVLCAGGVGTGEHLVAAIAMGAVGAWTRSEERRVGKEC